MSILIKSTVCSKINIQNCLGDNLEHNFPGIYEVLKLTVDNRYEKVHEYRDEGFFGELALLHGDRRAATVTSITEGTLWAIDRDSFRKIILSHEFQRIWSYEAFLRDVPLMKMLKEEEIWKVIYIPVWIYSVLSPQPPPPTPTPPQITGLLRHPGARAILYTVTCYITTYNLYRRWGGA